jgi:hypothetical protein
MFGGALPGGEVSFNGAERGRRYLTERESYVAILAIRKIGDDLDGGERARRNLRDHITPPV